MAEQELEREHLAELTAAEVESLKWAAGRELELHGGREGFEALETGWLKLCRALGSDPAVD